MNRAYPPDSDLIVLLLDLFSKAGFADITNNGFVVEEFSNFEISLMESGNTDSTWIGQYVRGSIATHKGLMIFLAPERHQTSAQIIDTACHEAGHAVWELLNEDDKVDWIQSVTNDPRCLDGPEEAFSDEFMNFVQGRLDQCVNADLFKRITTVQE